MILLMYNGKFHTYCLFNTQLCLENYVCLFSYQCRSIFTKKCVSAHTLMRERGRHFHPNVALDEGAGSNNLLFK